MTLLLLTSPIVFLRFGSTFFPSQQTTLIKKHYNQPTDIMPITINHPSGPKDSCLKRSSEQQGTQSQVKVARTRSKSDVHCKGKVQDDGDIFRSKDSVGNALIPSVVGRPCSVSPLPDDIDWSCVSTLTYPTMDMNMDPLDDLSDRSSSSASAQQLMKYFEHPIIQHELTPPPNIYSSCSSFSIGSYDFSCTASLGDTFRSSNNFSSESGYDQCLKLKHSSNSD